MGKEELGNRKQELASRKGIIQSLSAIFVYLIDVRHLRGVGHLKSSTPKDCVATIIQSPSAIFVY